MKIASLGFRTDVMLLELGATVVTDHGTHLVVRTPGNPDFHWGNFLLFDKPPRQGDAARWSALFAAEFPEAKHRAFGVDVADGVGGDATEHRAMGVEVEILTVMTASGLASSAPPPQADIRALSGDDDWRQALELDFATYGSPTGDDARRFAERRVAGYRGLCEAGHGKWYGAFVDGKLCAGAGLFAVGSGLARFQNVETHPGYRRRGLASAVLTQAAEEMSSAPDIETLVIVADLDGDAARLYRTLGFVDRERQVQLHQAD